MNQAPLPVMYGIKNCDTVRKARLWLEGRGVAYRFHDFRGDGLEPALLTRFEQALGWEALLNRRGTTFRALPQSERSDLDRERAMALMIAHPALIKRPVLELDARFLLGFSPDVYSQHLNPA